MEESVSLETNSRSSSSSSSHTETLTEFSTIINKLNPILTQMKHSTVITNSPAIHKAIDSLETYYNRAKAAVESQPAQTSPAKHIEELVQNLGRSLGLVLFAGREAPMSDKDKIEALCKEMMNVRFDSSSSSEYETDDETEKKTEEIVEEDEEEIRILSVDEAIMQIKSCGGDEERFKNGLLALSGFIIGGMVSNERILEEDVVKVLTSRLSSCNGHERVVIVKTLRYLALQDDQHKEKMKEMEFLSALVKSLTRDVEERREAVGLLMSVSNDDGGVKRRIGRIRGCIVMLVAIANGDDHEASQDAIVMLNSMSGNTQHALHMAEAGYFKPLIKYLKEGSEMSKVLMATALSRLQLTDQNKASLGQDGAIEPLVKMFNTGNLEAKLSALNALQTLSNSNQNIIKRLIDSGIVAPLLQLLFSVTSSLMTLREPASAILAQIAQSERILVKQDDAAHHMLSLLNVSSPAIQSHLLEALNNIVSHSSASKVRKTMNENGAIQLLLPFFTERDNQIRTRALTLVYALSIDIQGELIEQLDYTKVHILANIVATSTSEFEKAAALGILCNLPMSDEKITEILKKANLLPLMVFTATSLNPKNTTPTKTSLAESIAGLLLRFTVDKNLQHYAAENGAIPVLVKLLSTGSQIAKSKAALCLAHLSQNSSCLSKSRKVKWLCVAPSTNASCGVHGGYCSVKGTFCLVKAGAISPLVRVLEGDEREADEAVLNCLSTLLHDEIWEKGCNFLANESGVNAVIKVLRCGSYKAQEKALWILERVFRVEGCREEYGECAEVVLIDLAQNGDAMLAPAVAKVLAQLELLQDQSTYF